MATRIKLRRGTANEWIAANTLLAEGEQGYEKDTGRVKIGDGVTTWNNLPYNDKVTAGRAYALLFILGGSY